MDKIAADGTLMSVIASTKLSQILTDRGRQSIQAFMQLYRRRNVTMGQLNSREIDSIDRHLRHPAMGRLTKWINELNMG